MTDDSLEDRQGATELNYAMAEQFRLALLAAAGLPGDISVDDAEEALHVLHCSHAELINERDENCTGSLAESVKVWHERFTDLQAEHLKAGESWDRQRERLNVEIADWRTKVERYQETLETARNSAADDFRVFDELRRHLRAAESSRRDWAAEAMRLREQLERLENVALDRNAIFSGILVGVGGEHDDPPSDDQNWRAVGLIEQHIRRAMGPGYVTQAEERLLAAIKKACACVTDDQANQLAAGFSRPVCTVHEEGQ